MEKSNFQNLFVLFLVISLFVTGCGVPSVHPLYEKGDLITHKNLSGLWTSDGDTYYVVNVNEALKNPSKIPHQIYKFGKDSAKTALDLKKNTTKLVNEGLGKIYYIAKAKNDSISDLYYGGLMQLNKEYYFDLYKLGGGGFRFPMHLFVKAEFEGKKIFLKEFKTEFLESLIKNQELRIKHEYSDDKLLLTAPSKELQKFIRKYGDIKAAYGNTHTFTKQ